MYTLDPLPCLITRAVAPLHPRLRLHLDEKYLEMWMQGFRMYAVTLANLKLQAVGERERVKGRKMKSPRHVCLGLCVCAIPLKVS
jgi:hypothetical protein